MSENKNYTAKIGVVCLGRYTYDVAAALEIYKKTQEDLKTIEGVDWTIIEEPVIEKPDAENAVKVLKAADVDAVAIISGTFHLGHLALIIDRGLKVPVLLWAFNELPYNGGKIRLNSVCGMNLNASNLYKSGNRTFSYTVSDTIDRDWVKAVKMTASLKRSHVGIVGYRADGFFNLDIDELSSFRQTGVLLDHYELSDLFSAKIEDEKVSEREKELRKMFNCSGVTDYQVNKVANLCETCEDFLSRNSLDAIAVRCWPEHAATYGVAPCAMMSVLQSSGRIIACEGDVEGAESMLVSAAAGCEAPFLADLSQVNFEDDFSLMWHCGVAPHSLWDGCSDCTLDTYFAGGKGVTAGFVMKSGICTFMRIDSAGGKTRVFLSKGEAFPMEKQLSGTYAKVKFDCGVRKLLDSAVTNGIAHHLVMCYGDYEKSFEIFAHIMGWEVIKP